MAHSTQAAEDLAAPIDWHALRPKVTDELLAGITQRIVDAFAPEKVILFGSYAWGTPHEESDVDLLVVMESDLRPVERDAMVTSFARVPFLSMDVLVYTPTELRDRLAVGDGFVREVMATGKVLHER